MKTTRSLARTWANYAHQSSSQGGSTASAATTIAEKLKQEFHNNYFAPTKEDLLARADDIEALLRGGTVAVSIPMREDKPAVLSLLDNAEKLLPKKRVVIIDNGSTQEVVEAVSRHPLALVVQQDELLSILDQERLLKILGTDRMPRGKGVAVCAGYLLQYLLHECAPEHASSWIFHTDADIGANADFQPLQHLTYGMLKNKQAAHVKIAQSARNNESTMAVRSALGALGAFTANHTDPSIRAFGVRAADLFKKLAKYKWILSGIFALTYEAAMRRPFATGYIEEVLMTTFVEDAGLDTCQVANENRCADGQNDFMKESIVVQQGANFIMCLASIQTPVDQWSLQDIERINTYLRGGTTPLAFIAPTGPDPVIGYAVENERIIPSIATLAAAGMIDMEKGKQLIASYLK